MPMRGSEIAIAHSFASDLEELRPGFPEIGEVVDELKNLLTLDYALPEVLVDPTNMPGVYSILLDYPPKGSAGLALFLVTYHATAVTPSMIEVYRTYTLLTITLR